MSSTRTIWRWDRFGAAVAMPTPEGAVILRRSELFGVRRLQIASGNSPFHTLTREQVRELRDICDSIGGDDEQG